MTKKKLSAFVLFLRHKIYLFNFVVNVWKWKPSTVNHSANVLATHPWWGMLVEKLYGYLKNKLLRIYFEKLSKKLISRRPANDYF